MTSNGNLLEVSAAAIGSLNALNGSEPLTMSSREIADLCEKRHDNVMRDIKSMLEGLEIAALTFEGSYIGDNGKALPCFNLPKDLTLTLVAGYNVKLRKRIIDRWMELEGQVKPLDYSDPRVLLGVMSHLQAQVVERDAVIAEQGTRLKSLDRLSAAKGSMCITDAAKSLFDSSATASMS